MTTSLADLKAEHRADTFGDDAPICRRCGVAYPCQPLLAATGRPTVPCTACTNAHERGDDVWAFPNRWAIHPGCAQALQPRDEHGLAAYRAARDAARIELLAQYVAPEQAAARAEGLAQWADVRDAVEIVLGDIRAALAMP